jgi:hypothetical protein
MIFVIKSSSKPYNFLKITWNSLKDLYLINEFYIKILIYFKIDVFYSNQFLHNLSKNLIWIRFKRIEANYLYV